MRVSMACEHVRACMPVCLWHIEPGMACVEDDNLGITGIPTNRIKLEHAYIMVPHEQKITITIIIINIVIINVIKITSPRRRRLPGRPLQICDLGINYIGPFQTSCLGKNYIGP